ncbi:glycosyltransferase family 4 protein [Helicobacter sp. MIT 01-3238]|uniref:glycosyltransferase family 4 protein n=1 Tax=Helicobacter sp. MIT 01-3238 TaxID=398627 RepID=UPI000E1F5292|nr:glycosyltransferase family 4 protein [Helicobacter sp. MIT 01-3238]RDU51318.1 hypothetical protein CQA40_10530 [Helicobacter sp. MIT 01-3238]
MKILLIIEDITIGGGAERVVVNLANAFNAMRFDSGKYCCGGSKPQIEVLSLKNKNKNIPYPLSTEVRVVCYHDLCDLPPYKCDIKTIKGHYKRLCIKSKVFLYKLRFLVKFKLIKTGEVLQRKLNVVINKNKYDFVIDNTFADFYPYYKNKNTKYIHLKHISYYFLSQCTNDKYFKSLKNFDTLILLTNKELDIWQRYHSNVRVIPNFLPTIPQVSTNHSQKVVLSVGRMDSGDQKGFLRLLDIWKMVQTKIVDYHDSALPNLAMTNPHPSLRGESVDSPKQSINPKMDCHESLRASRNDNMANDLREWKLIIVGDGVLKSEIESKIRALNLGESVLLKPFTKDIEREYLGASIYAMASHFEGFPMVLLESTAYGLAPISFDIATGPSEIIEHNKSGFLIADNDLESYAEKLITLMRDESMRVAFGKEAKKIVSERFSKEVIMEKWREVFGIK